MVDRLSAEDPSRLAVVSGQDFVDNILFLPIRIFQYLLIKLDFTALDLRFVSIAFAAIACLLMFLLLKKWHTTRVAFAACILFASSSVFLAYSRFATPDAVYFVAIPTLLVCGTWLRRKNDIAKIPIASVLVAALLYLPGMCLFVFVGVIALRKRLKKAWQLNPAYIKLATLGLFSVSIAPLVYSFYQNPKQIVGWVGLPELSSLNLTLFADNLWNLFDALLWSGLEDASIWLVGTPLLDVFSIAVLILGIYSYQFGYHPLRKRVLFGFTFIAILLAALGGPVSITLLVPILYIFMAAGIALLLQQWFTVFPKNPLARSVSLILVSLAIAISCLYQTQRYFIAWPSSPATKQAIETEEL
jgi:hypothetical protein